MQPLFVQVFLRGGADGLSLLVPHGDPDLARHRPTLGFAPPGHDGGCLDLDGFFGLHPAAASLLPLWAAGQLVPVHALGTTDRSRSHFEAQDHLEHGNPEGEDLGSGWLARHLRERRAPVGPLTAVALGRTLPESLRGAPSATVLDGLDELPDPEPSLTDALAALYRTAGGPLGDAGARTVDALARVRALADPPADAANFSDSAFGRHLQTLAHLVRGQVGVEVACVDLGGWDTHFVQGALFSDLVRQLADGLSAFREAVGSEAWSRTTVLVMSEFGRRIPENGSIGTDHGTGGAGFVLGGTVRGGRVLCDWPGLAASGVLDAHDLRVTTDVRVLQAEILRVALGQERLDRVLPGFDEGFAGVLR